MKRLLTILPVLAIVAAGCNPEPYADASINPNPAYVGEDIRFISYSNHSSYVEWKMGDGFFYDDPVVDHYYVDPGIYEVQLKAFGDNGGVDIAYYNVDVEGSILTVIVSLWTDEDAGELPGYLVPSARVRLYPTLDDWNAETNLAAEAYTNSVGECDFENLSYQRYYVDVYEANHDNYTLAGEDIGFIETDLLEGIYYWTFDAKVDYYAKKAAKAERSISLEKKVPTGDDRVAGEVSSKVSRR